MQRTGLTLLIMRGSGVFAHESVAEFLSIRDLPFLCFIENLNNRTN